MCGGERTVPRTQGYNEPMKIRVATYNIHKGFSQFNRRLTVHELRDRLRTLNPDLVFLQEVQGLHQQHAARHGGGFGHGQSPVCGRDR